MTKTEIANIALAKFREGRITNIESTTDPVAVVMNDQYDHALELVLEEHRWNFAGKRVTLTQLSDDPPFGWDHQYQLPSDIIRLKDVNGEDVEASSRLFAIEGTALLTNDDEVTITYVAKVTDTNLFSPSFVEALCFKLASITCARLTGDSELAIMLDKQYNYALSKAVHNDTKAAGSRDRNLMQRLMDSAPILGGSYRYPSSGSAGGGTSSTSGTVPAHKHGLTDLLQSSATDGQTIVWNATEERWEAGDAGGASPLTTKGDIFIHDTDGDARLPLGSSGQFLKADPANPNGLTWDNIAGGGDLLASNNLSELTPTASTARSNLGLGTAATSNTGDFAAASHTHATTDITSGTMADARIAQTNVTQHQAALSLTASQVSDFDTEVSNNTSVAANTAKVSNATHTGEVTGSTALTVDKTAISGKTQVTAATDDYVLIGDTSDTNNLKKVTAQSIADLAAGGGASQLSDLSDVVSATNTDKFVLVANGTTGYVGRALLEADISDLQAYITGITGEPLSDLSDVTITSIASGEILRWNGSAWINQTHAEAGLPTITTGSGAPASTPNTEGDIYVDTTNDDAYVAVGSFDSNDWSKITAGAGGGGSLNDGDTLTTGLTFPNTGLHILDTNTTHDLIIKPNSDLTVDRTLSLTTGDADRTLTINADTTLGGGSHSGTNTGDQDLTSYQLKPAEGAFVDGDKTKLDGIETGADVTDSTSVVAALDSAVLTDAGTPAATDQVLIKDAGTGALQTADFSDFGGGGDVATDTIWDAAGDLAIGTGADTAARLAIGTNGQVLTSNGTTAVWAAAGAADNLGDHTATQDLNMAGFNVDSADSIYLDEKSAADVDVVGDGQLWVKDSSPNRLMFTDDTGQDFELLETYMGFACSDETTALTTGQKIATDMPFDFTVTRVYASLVTAGTTTAITVDVEDEGVSILNAVLSISAGSNNAETSTFASAATEYALTKGDLLTVDVDSVDSGATGAGLKIYLVGYRT